MKKILFYLCVAAMLGAMSSCCNTLPEVPGVSPVIVDKTRTLIVTTNVPANITYNGKTFSNVTTATFEKTEGKGNLKVTPVSNQYYDQDEMPIDFYDKLTLAVNVQLVKKPTNKVSQADAKNGKDVTNDTDNQNATGVTATVKVPANTVITGNTTDPFSVTVFVPAETVIESTNKGDDMKANVLIVRLEPNGASFSEPVIVNLHIPNSSGFELVCVSEDGKTTLPMTDLGNDDWEVSLPSAGDWSVYLKAQVVNVVQGSEFRDGETHIVAGNNNIPYKVKSGTIETSKTNCPLVTSFLEKKFGYYYEATKRATFTSNAPGYAYWQSKQPYTDYTFVSGNKTFTCRVYGEPTFEIIRTYAEKGGHSGGNIG